MGIDVTLSVFLDNAVIDYRRKTEEIMGKYGFSVDIAEIAMEKALLELKREKISLYASALESKREKKIEKQNLGGGNNEQSAQS